MFAFLHTAINRSQEPGLLLAIQTVDMRVTGLDRDRCPPDIRTRCRQQSTGEAANNYDKELKQVPKFSQECSLLVRH